MVIARKLRIDMKFTVYEETESSDGPLVRYPKQHAKLCLSITRMGQIDWDVYCTVTNELIVSSTEWWRKTRLEIEIGEE
jgi:hypothetical protein